MMKERPIIFSSEMVRAILEGRKTQTRRVVKKLKDKLPKYIKYTFHETKDGEWEIGYVYCDGKCPYGVPGDRLWVRETWAHDDPDCKDIHCEISDHIWYRASEAPIVADSFAGSAAWKPSIFMPRWASRITLEIVSVRVERLQEISEANAVSEGCQPILVPPDGGGAPFTEGFMQLWDSINAARGYSWESNPWVWVIEFKRLEA